MKIAVELPAEFESAGEWLADVHALEAAGADDKPQEGAGPLFLNSPRSAALGSRARYNSSGRNESGLSTTKVKADR